MALRAVAACAGLVALFGCAHSYYYLPEIDGEGATHGKKGGIIYSIPPNGTPELTMRVRSLGLKKARDTVLLGMRMSFVRPNRAAQAPSENREYLLPEEQILRLEGGHEIRPAYIHTKARRDNRVELTGTIHEVVELLFPVPRTGEGNAPSIEIYYFQWKVHFGAGAGSTASQTLRFDRYDARPQQAAELYPEDPDYPYDVSPLDLPGWTVIRDPFWWAIDPWWPWW